jgi:pimeloyl-ACP methyl ester carboxylesterase
MNVFSAAAWPFTLFPSKPSHHTLSTQKTPSSADAARDDTHDATAYELAAPHFALLALEMRAFWEFGAVVPTWPLLQRAPQGDGHTVIIFPGLAASDSSTLPLRKYLETLGYEVIGWDQGNNFGPRAGVLDAIRQRVFDAYQAGSRDGKKGRKVSLIGWSLGGVYAREIAKEMPDCVRGVITLGTPFAGSPRSTNAWRLYEMVSGRKIEREAAQFKLDEAPPVPTTSVYSRTDGVVAWKGSIQSAAKGKGHAQTENIEVFASHVGLGLNPSVWWAIADRLAQPEGQWQAFTKPPMMGLGGWVYPQSPKRSKVEATEPLPRQRRKVKAK